MITIHLADIKVNIIPNPKKYSQQRDFQLLVDYVDAVKDIYDDIHFRKCA